MKKGKRKFIKFIVSTVFITSFANFFLIKKNYKKKMVLNKTFSKFWLLDTNDS
tara:strand:+ start:108 stop:266 length:159 start_codon:yes stop_codon:yes gene_type:complete